MATSTLPRCHTCQHGCNCQPTDQGCGHYGCWGRNARLQPACEGAAHERSHEQRMYAQRRAALATRDRIRARLSDSYWRVVAACGQ